MARPAFVCLGTSATVLTAVALALTAGLLEGCLADLGTAAAATAAAAGFWNGFGFWTGFALTDLALVLVRTLVRTLCLVTTSAPYGRNIRAFKIIKRATKSLGFKCVQEKNSAIVFFLVFFADACARGK